MKLKTIIRLIILVAFVSSCSIETKSPVDYVDPFIGTDAGGHTFPGACLPFGMVQLSPDNGYQGVKAYSYDQETILGFSHTHLSGTGPYTKTHYNNVLIMPGVGELEVLPGVAKELNALAREKLQERLGKLSDEEGQKQAPIILNEEKLKIIDNNNMDEAGYYRTYAFEGYESSYSHQEEEASPGYYAVNLKDYDIKAELTATEHVGFHRYTFPESDQAHIVIDVSHSLTPGRDTYVKILNDKQIEGYVTGDMEGSYDLPLTCYFFAEFSKSFASVGTWNGEDIYEDLREISGNDGVGAFVNFATSAGEQVLIRLGISLTPYM